MANYICAVSGLFPENYQIGLHARTWGVEEKYAHKITPVRRGELLFLYVGGSFRSLHTVQSEAFFDRTPLWPEKDGSLFPHRIKISAPLAVGEIPLTAVAGEISFMRGLAQPTGALQGPHGVFNPRLTDEDAQFIRSRLAAPVPSEIKIDPVEAERSVERHTSILRLYANDLEDRIIELLPAKGLRLEPNGLHVSAGSDSIDALATDSRGNLVVVAINRGLAPQEMLLKILRQMSWARQNRANGRDVRGVIIAEAADRMLLALAGEVPNISIQYYRLTLELADRPAHANGRVA